MTTPGELDSGAFLTSPAMVESVSRHGRSLTLVVLLTVAGCAAGTWWQVQRALEGNLLSDLYAFLWPFYGCYVVYVWLRLRHGATTLIGQGAGVDPEPEQHDEELQAYNRYLATKRADAERRAR
ncbi:MAG: hypothetical protein ACRDQ1_20410 [Sciscionella sp.]